MVLFENTYKVGKGWGGSVYTDRKQNCMHSIAFLSNCALTVVFKLFNIKKNAYQIFCQHIGTEKLRNNSFYIWLQWHKLCVEHWHMNTLNTNNCVWISDFGYKGESPQALGYKGK